MDSKKIRVKGKIVEVSNWDKIYWPKEKYTKGDLVEYYSTVAPYIIPYLKNRPLMLHRYPNGISKPGFYQKNLEKHPEWVETVSIKHENKYVNYVLVQNEPTLIYLANLGCIDFHPFHSRISHLKNPDYLIFDMDPVDISFDHVIEVTLAIHEILDELGVDNYCKTSGGRGLHIYVPTGAAFNYEETKNLAKAIAMIAQEQLPKIVSLERSPSKRKKKVYIDFLRNIWGQTIASPYSVRPKPNAPVSTPLKWKEVKQGLDVEEFTIETVPKRLKSLGDIFKPVLKRASVKKLRSLLD